MARGHRVDNVPELPLVVDGMKGLSTTKALLTSLEAFGCGDDLAKVLWLKSPSSEVSKVD